MSATLESVLEALSAYDDAKRTHLSNCWVPNSKTDRDIDMEYNRYLHAQMQLHDAIGAYTGRHVVEFQSLAGRSA